MVKSGTGTATRREHRPGKSPAISTKISGRKFIVASEPLVSPTCPCAPSPLFRCRKYNTHRTFLDCDDLLSRQPALDTRSARHALRVRVVATGEIRGAFCGAAFWGADEA